MIWIVSLAIFNGLLTSIILETFILAHQMAFAIALKTALGMSLLSMISMEAAMNLTDYMFSGGAILTWLAVQIMLLAGFANAASPLLPAAKSAWQSLSLIGGWLD